MTTTTTSSAGAAAPVADVDCAVGSAPCLDPSTAHGFELDEAEVTFWGLCPACQALRTPTETDPTGRRRSPAVARWGAADDGNDLGLFGPDSVSWRLYAEPILLVGGLRALYLQALHPRAVAGVVQNSAYERDPWGRLERTGTTSPPRLRHDRPGSRRRPRVQAIHARLRGVDPAHRRVVPDRRTGPAALGTRHRGRVVPDDRGIAPGSTSSRGDRPVLRRAAARRALVGLDPASVPGRRPRWQDYYQAATPAADADRRGTRRRAVPHRPPTAAPAGPHAGPPRVPLRRARSLSACSRRGPAACTGSPAARPPTCPPRLSVRALRWRDLAAARRSRRGRSPGGIERAEAARAAAGR